MNKFVKQDSVVRVLSVKWFDAWHKDGVGVTYVAWRDFGFDDSRPMFIIFYGHEKVRVLEFSAWGYPRWTFAGVAVYGLFGLETDYWKILMREVLERLSALSFDFVH